MAQNQIFPNNYDCNTSIFTKIRNKNSHLAGFDLQQTKWKSVHNFTRNHTKREKGN